MQSYRFVFVMNLAAIVSAVWAAAAWIASAAVPFPIEGGLTADSPNLQIFADALLDQIAWLRIGAAFSAVAISFYVMAMITHHLSSKS